MESKITKWADGLRELADFAEQQPELFENHSFGETINLFTYTPEDMAEKTRLLGNSEKVASGGWYTMRRCFGPHKIDLNIARDKFCERVQSGTKIMTKPDPEILKDVPTIEVEEPVYEWICPESVLNPNAK